MKYKKYIIMPMTLALLSVATSCEQEELPPAMPEGDVVEVTAAIGDNQQTRVSQTADNVYTFDDKDKIHIVGWYGAWDEYNKPWEMALDVWWNDAVSTYNATSDKWKTEPYMRWQNGDGLQHNFLAWWPEDIIKTNENLTAVNVTVTGDYRKDDILVARWAGQHPVDNVLNLKFEHLLSRFDVHLNFGNDYPEPENISIETNLKNAAVCNFFSGEVTAQQGEGIIMQVNPHSEINSDWSGTCITVPHAFPMNEQLLTIRFTANGEEKTINYTHSDYFNFRSNERITLVLQVGIKEATLITTNVGYPGGWSEKDETELN